MLEKCSLFSNKAEQMCEKCYKNALRPLECNVSDVRKIKLMSQKCQLFSNKAEQMCEKCTISCGNVRKMLYFSSKCCKNVPKCAKNVQFFKDLWTFP
jgi:hypothetical protein